MLEFLRPTRSAALQPTTLTLILGTVLINVMNMVAKVGIARDVRIKIRYD